MDFKLTNRRFSYRPQASLGIASNLANVLNCGRTIGYVEMKDIPKFDRGDNSVFLPIENWRNVFSIQLQEELNGNLTRPK